MFGSFGFHWMIGGFTWISRISLDFGHWDIGFGYCDTGCLLKQKYSALCKCAISIR
jgi:hypothetical protein